MIKMRGITKTFKSRERSKEPLLVLDKVSLTIEKGQTLGLIGPSGCGKSTLMRIMLRLIPADQGTIIWQGEDISKRKGKQLLPFRQKVQFISQHPESFFGPSYKLGKSVVEPLKIFKLYDQTKTEDALGSMLEKVKINHSLLDRYPHQVSGGEIQRLAICRALLLRPSVLVLDEATSMLDVSVQAQILNILKDLQMEEQLADRKSVV